jgi:hypothetical protein
MLQSTAAELESFADFKHDTVARLGGIGAELEASRAAQDTGLHTLSQLSSLVQVGGLPTAYARVH